MDRLSQLRSTAGGSGDSTLDTTSPPSEAFMTANENSKYFSLSEVDSTFDISHIKDVALTSTSTKSDTTITGTDVIIGNLSPINKKIDRDNYKIGKQIEAANILSGGVEIFEDNDNSYDGDELVIDDNVDVDDKTATELKGAESEEYKLSENFTETPTLMQGETSKDTEVVLQIDGKNVDAIDIGNGLYLYRKDGEEELAAVQIIDNQEQPSFKFLKVRENAEGNLEVYEEIEIEVTKEVPTKDGKLIEKNTSHVPINKDLNKIINDSSSNKVTEKKNFPTMETTPISTSEDADSENKLLPFEGKPELNLNGKMMKFSESRKSPVVGSFMPMTHSTPNKEGVPLTKTMVDQQLHPSRHSDNVKKTIEVHTDNCKQKLVETSTKHKEMTELNKEPDETAGLGVTAGNNVFDKGEKVEPKSTVSENKLSILNVNEQKDKKDSITENLDSRFHDEGTNALPSNDLKDNCEHLIKEAKVTQNDMPQNTELEKPPLKSNEIKQNQVETAVGKIEQFEEIESTQDMLTTNMVSDSDIKDQQSCKSSTEITLTDLSKVETSVEEEDLIKQATGDVSTAVNKIHGQTLVLPKERTLDVVDSSDNISGNKNRSGASLEVATTTDEVNCPKLLKEEINKTTDIENPKNIVEVKDATPDENNVDTISSAIILNITKKPEEPERKSEPKLTLESKSAAKIENVKEFDTVAINKDQLKVKFNEEATQKTADQEKDDIKLENIKIQEKAINNNNSAVPFGQWTEANRQAFLNKIKETKAPVYNTSSKSIKNSNDLNKRDVLKKIDSQRQTTNANTKNSELNKPVVKNQSLFINKTAIAKPESKSSSAGNESKIPIKSVTSEPNSKKVSLKNMNKSDAATTAEILSADKPVPLVVTNTLKRETPQRKVNAQDLIDKTIEELINRTYPMKPVTEDINLSVQNNVDKKNLNSTVVDAIANNQTTLDAIELKMSETQGTNLKEIPPEKPQDLNSKLNINKSDRKKEKKANAQESDVQKVPNLAAAVPLKETAGATSAFDSEEEIIEHEPVTGDIETNKSSLSSPITVKDESFKESVPKHDEKRTAVITEKDFDKFVRRNSVTYQNCLTVNVPETQVVPANYSTKQSEIPVRAPTKIQNFKHIPSNKVTILSNIPVNDDPSNKNYQSKLQIAYQNALTVKRKMEGPITIIEDKPVKVVFMDTNAEFTPGQLNVQGKDLSPSKTTGDVDNSTISSCDSFDFDVVDTGETKSHDESKSKIKHQRKQVLTPVEEPEFELIQPSDLGIDVSPKKKRRFEEIKNEKPSTKSLVHKKSYLLGRSITREEKVNGQNTIKEVMNSDVDMPRNKTTVSAIDNLVKAAELLENQSENKERKCSINDSQQQTPTKRGRGRPRKYPLPDGSPEKSKPPSPNKKPRLIDAKPIKHETSTEDEDSSGDEMVKENWTMGKINENIVCPICNKLFRTENVVFKHVKHCTGPSPNRSDAGKRRARRMRDSQDSDSKSFDSHSDPLNDDDDDDDDDDVKISEIKKIIPNKRKSNDSKSETETDEVVVIEDTPIKNKSKEDNRKQHDSRKETRNKPNSKLTHLIVCEYCGKTFRQLSYLDSHRLQHTKQGEKKIENVQSTKSVFSCEICKKEFRKLHHLVQHRIIHNSNSTSAKGTRKSSSEQSEVKVESDEVTKQSEDTSAGFRCEPCDKSFRKLHHLVEHRETHDGINRQKTTITPSTPSNTVEKSTPPPQCEICKKTFRKLHHLMEHKEQHNETSSEKSDDKSVQSSLSTKDIIHECPLCYMVFPNEHSLNKHTVICQRKKRQSKMSKPNPDGLTDAVEGVERHDSIESNINDEDDDDDEPKIVTEEIKVIDLEKDEIENDVKITAPETVQNLLTIDESLPEKHIEGKVENLGAIVKEDIVEVSDRSESAIVTKVATNLKKREEKEIVMVQLKKKIAPKEKVGSALIKRQKVTKPPQPVVHDLKPVTDSSDDDEVRYMLNPNYQIDATAEGKTFMKIRANKRSSLQIERPDSKELIKRRTSLQHPPKIPRLKPKTVEAKVVALNVKRRINKVTEAPASDSDDSDVKYSFPTVIAEKQTKPAKENRTKETKLIKPQRKSLADKRKTLSSVAKRKSSGRPTISSQKTIPSPAKQLKKRTTEIEHRCDCGQLFSSAALLSRHTTLAHTPPRIRKRRSPPPEIDTKPAPKQTRKSTERPKQPVGSRKSSTRSDTTAPTQPKTTRKSSVKLDVKPPEARKSLKSSDKLETSKQTTVVKAKRNTAHRGVPVPEKMRKLMQKSKS